VTDNASGAGSFDDNNQEGVGIKSFSLLDKVKQFKLQASFRLDSQIMQH